MTLDADALFVRLDKLRERFDRLEKAPDPTNDWQNTRLLIRALTESVMKGKSPVKPTPRPLKIDAPEAVQGDWRDLVDALTAKGLAK